MKRLSLIAALAIGLAGCLDSSNAFGTGALVTEDPNLAALAVSFDSTRVQIDVGSTLDLPLTISGDNPDAGAITIVCLSSDPDIVEVTANLPLRTCRVTGLEAGLSTITAEVTAGEETDTAETTVSVISDVFGD